MLSRATGAASTSRSESRRRLVSDVSETRYIDGAPHRVCGACSTWTRVELLEPADYCSLRAREACQECLHGPVLDEHWTLIRTLVGNTTPSTFGIELEHQYIDLSPVWIGFIDYPGSKPTARGTARVPSGFQERVAAWAATSEMIARATHAWRTKNAAAAAQTDAQAAEE